LLEAVAWPGPSLVAAYSTCIAHGIDMARERRPPVASGAKPPTIPLADFTHSETRFSALARTDPQRARHLLALAQEDVDERWRYYQQLAAAERSLPQGDGEQGLTASKPGPDADLP
jgi:pyruvate-ferredoxin/flavodoxin oxidoreductase